MQKSLLATGLGSPRRLRGSSPQAYFVDAVSFLSIVTHTAYNHVSIAIREGGFGETVSLIERSASAVRSISFVALGDA